MNTEENQNQAQVSEPAERTHAPRSMSKWPAVLACPCFEGKEFSEAAKKGTEVHERLAEWLTAYVEKGTVPEYETTLDFYEAGALRCAKDLIQFANASGIDRKDIKVEAHVRIDDDASGYADCLWNGENGAFVFDFKTWRNASRDYTPQLAGYAVAACPADAPDDYRVTLAVGYGDYKEYDMQFTTLGECREWYRKAMAAFDNRASAQPKQCAWCELCKYNSTCPAFRAIAQKVIDTPSLRDAPVMWAELPSARKAQLLVMADTVVKWGNSIKDLGKDSIVSGEVIEDPMNGIKYDVRESGGRKSPRCEDSCRMLKGLGVTDAEIRKYLKISAADLKEILKAHGIKGKEADALIDDVSDRGNGSTIMFRKS